MTRGHDIQMSDPRLSRRTRNASSSITSSLNNSMAYTRRSSSYTRRYRRYGRRYSSYGRSSRSSIGEYRAANQQKDSSRIVLKWSNQQTISVATGANQGTTSFAAWQALKNSGFYNNFAQMYDQIKLNAVRVKITLLAASSSIYSSTNNPVFVSAWDRNGRSAPASALSFNIISSYGSAQTRPLTQGANFGVMRTLYASTMTEKSQYVATAELPTQEGDEQSLGIQVPFVPILLLGIFSAGTTTASQELKFNVEWQFDVTFRGTRNDPNAIEA